jgi:hypothetical protein
MALSTIPIERPVLSVGFLRIRDSIEIDAKLKEKLEKNSSGSVTLVAREIKHAAGIDLILHGRQVLIVADHYDAKGRMIDVSGADVADVKDGSNGSTGYADHNHDKNVPGGPGAPGFQGNNGNNAGSIRIIAQRLGDVRLVAKGGRGGKGGDGGNGGNGGAGTKAAPPHFDELAGTMGGHGGAAGNGGVGGKGGQIDVEFTAAGVPPHPLAMEVDAGPAGAAGHPGLGGKSGQSLDANGEKGAAGHAGAPGALGTTRLEPIGAANYWTHAKARLHESTTAKWAAYRLPVGIYFYRQYKPNKDQIQDEFHLTLADKLRLAAIEFDAVLHLQPGNGDAIRYGKQIELAQNVLGLPINLDLDPDFEQYEARYLSFANFIAEFYQLGIQLLTAGEDQRLTALLHTLDIGRIETEIAFTTDDRDAAKDGARAAKLAYADVEGRLTRLNEQIKVAIEKKPDDSISIGAIFTTVGEVAAAVGSVIAAVPTAGASLYALVPSLAGLAVQLNDIGGHIFEATDAETAALKQQYDQVGKTADTAGKAVVNLAQSIQRLADGKTQSNGEAVGLMRQGIELSHELLIAKLRGDQADLTLHAREIQLEGSKKLRDVAASQSKKLKDGEKIFIDAGRSAVRATQRKIDTALNVAFLAQRSVEIYALKDQSGRLSFDVGFIHPDIEADFDDEEIELPHLITAYSTAFLALLDPLDLQNEFDQYFKTSSQFALVPGTFAPSINDKASLDAFRTSDGGRRSITLSIPFDDLPPDQLEMKIEQVSLALVGASSTGPALNCKIEHGCIYLQRTRDGSKITQALSEQITQTNPQFMSFNDHKPLPSTGPQGHQRAKTDHLWGRGVGGEWLITIEDNELKHNGVDLAGLTEIQLWIETQAFVSKH